MTNRSALGFVNITASVTFAALLLLAVSVSCACGQHRAHSSVERLSTRIGLVVGNAAYNGELEALDTPANDARAMADALRKVGFSLVGGSAQVDVNGKRFQGLIQEMETAIHKRPGALVLIYFSGHGFVDRGRNSLVPTDFDRRKRTASEAIPIASLATAAEKAGAGRVIMLVDACRTNSDGTLIDEPAPAKTFIGFAASFGSPALEYKGELHGRYTQALLDVLPRDWIFTEDFHSSVALLVSQGTEGLQIPVYRAGYSAQGVPLGSIVRSENNRVAPNTRDKERQQELVQRCNSLSMGGAIFVMTTMVDFAVQSEALAKRMLDAKRVCQDAYDAGARDPKTLVGAGVAISISRLDGKVFLPLSSEQEKLSALLIFQAAEEGDEWGNLLLSMVQAYQAEKFGLKTLKSIAYERMIRAGNSGKPYIGATIGSMLVLSPAAASDVPLDKSVPRDPVAGTKMLISAAQNHSVAATQILYSAKAVERGLTPANNNVLINLPADLDVRRMVEITLDTPADVDWGAHSDGLSPLASLKRMAVNDGLNGLAGPPDPLLVAVYGSSLEEDLAHAAPNPSLAFAAEATACVLAGGARPAELARDIPPDTMAAARFFRLAVRLGSSTAERRLWEMMEDDQPPCVVTFKK